MNDVSFNLVCVLIRGGIEIWVEKERAKKLISYLKLPNCPQFIEYNDQLINKADISGVFSALAIEEKKRRNNGEWKCKYGVWHEKFKKCECELQDIRWF